MIEPVVKPEPEQAKKILESFWSHSKNLCIFFQIIEEHGCFDKYIWSFVNYKPIVGHFRYLRQIPIRTSKADAISKDLIRRGFRGRANRCIFFMQVANLTNDHVVNCFICQDCITAADDKDKVDGVGIYAFPMLVIVEEI